MGYNVPAGLPLRTRQGHALLGRGLPGWAMDRLGRHDYGQTLLPGGPSFALGERLVSCAIGIPPEVLAGCADGRCIDWDGTGDVTCQITAVVADFGPAAAPEAFYRQHTLRGLRGLLLERHMLDRRHDFSVSEQVLQCFRLSGLRLKEKVGVVSFLAPKGSSGPTVGSPDLTIRLGQAI